MTYGLYCIRDKYTTFMAPALDQNDESAKRGFGFAINNNQEFSYSPADFDLYKVGEFDTVSGQIVAEVPIKFISNGMEVFNEKS